MKISFAFLFIALPVFAADLRSVRLTEFQSPNPKINCAITTSDGFRKTTVLEFGALPDDEKVAWNTLRAAFLASLVPAETSLESVTIEPIGQISDFTKSVVIVEGQSIESMIPVPGTERDVFNLAFVVQKAGGSKLIESTTEQLTSELRDLIFQLWNFGKIEVSK